MLDPFTLFAAAIIQLDVLGVGLLLAWMMSRRSRVITGVLAALALGASLLLLGGAYLWSVGFWYGASVTATLLAVTFLVPLSIVMALALRLGWAEMLLFNLRPRRNGQPVFMDADVNAAEALEDDLRRAMARGNELRVFYQPIFHASTRTVAGFEALLRWQHPERGPISPATFIPIAERSNLIVPLGAWVMETACADASSWPHGWYVSVNISPVQLEKAQFVRQVCNILDRTGLASDRLELEVTEGVMVGSKNREIDRLAELRRTGVRVAIDDFGTGYSSLGYLNQLPFDTLKVDRAFVRNLENDSSARAIVGAVLTLSHQLEREVVAEGVETEEQYSILSDLGCHRMQGWLLGQAMPLEDVVDRFVKLPEPVPVPVPVPMPAATPTYPIKNAWLDS